LATQLESYGVSANLAGLYKAEDTVTGVMRLPGNILFNGQWCFTVSETAQEDICEITGSKGKISFPFLDTGLSNYCRRRRSNRF
jgi:predicted dehydrogenase